MVQVNLETKYKEKSKLQDFKTKKNNKIIKIVKKNEKRGAFFAFCIIFEKLLLLCVDFSAKLYKKKCGCLKRSCGSV
jgi:hypothetical protein